MTHLSITADESPRDPEEEIKSLGADAANITLPPQRAILSIVTRRREIMFRARSGLRGESVVFGRVSCVTSLV